MTDFETNASLRLDDELIIDLTEPPQDPQSFPDLSPVEQQHQRLWYTFGRFVGATVVTMHQKNQEIEELRETTTRDALTGLYNRKFFEQRFEKLHASFVHRRRSDMESLPNCMLVADADHFKQVNDTYGHDIGDIVLIRLSQIFGEEIHRDEDIIARLGGEEFGILLPNTNIWESQRLANRVREAVKQDWIMREIFAAGRKRIGTDVALPFSVSIGVTEISEPMTYGQAYRQADVAMYKAKESGRDQVIVY